MNKLITREEFFDITGAKSSKRICNQLRIQGISFTVRCDGWPSLSWDAYNRQVCEMGKSEATLNNGFNIEAIN